MLIIRGFVCMCLSEELPGLLSNREVRHTFNPQHCGNIMWALGAMVHPAEELVGLVLHTVVPERMAGG